MKFKIPLPLQQEHEALHERLRLATQAEGEVGEAAKTLAQLMHPHLVKEDQFALPTRAASGGWRGALPEMTCCASVFR